MDSSNAKYDLALNSMTLNLNKEIFENRSTGSIVVFADWKRDERSTPVVLKLVSTFNQRCLDAEIEVLKAMQDFHLDNVVEFRGVVSGIVAADHVVGTVPEELKAFLSTSLKGIATKGYSASLEHIMENRAVIGGLNVASIELHSITVKIRILCEVMKGLADLHSLGIIHGDIKPSNILLSDQNPPSVKLCDFGLSHIKEELMREDKKNPYQASTVRHTTVFKGTLVYSAPEMILENVKSSRSTDIYAFGIVAWEVLSGERFLSDQNLGQIITSHNKRITPNFTKLQGKYDQRLIQLLSSCCDHERSNRPSSILCCSYLSSILIDYEKEVHDIFFSYAWADQNFLSHIPISLNRLGYRVWFDLENMGHDLNKSMIDGVKNSKVFLACLSRSYFKSKNCKKELKAAVKNHKIIICLIVDEFDPSKPIDWIPKKYLIKYHIRNYIYLNLSEIKINYQWELHRIDNSSNFMKTDEEKKKQIALWDEIKKLFRFLRDYGIYPRVHFVSYLNGYEDRITPIFVKIFPEKDLDSNKLATVPLKGEYIQLTNMDVENPITRNYGIEEMLFEITQNENQSEEFICALYFRLSFSLNEKEESNKLDLSLIPVLIDCLQEMKQKYPDNSMLQHEKVTALLHSFEDYPLTDMPDRSQYALLIKYPDLSKIETNYQNYFHFEDILPILTELIYCLMCFILLAPSVIIPFVTFFYGLSPEVLVVFIFLCWMFFYPFASLTYCLYRLIILACSVSTARVEPVLWFQNWGFPSFDEDYHSYWFKFLVRFHTFIFYLLSLGLFLMGFCFLPMDLKWQWTDLLISCVQLDKSTQEFHYWGSSEYRNDSLACSEPVYNIGEDFGRYDCICYTQKILDSCQNNLDLAETEISKNCGDYLYYYSQILPKFTLVVQLYVCFLMILFGVGFYYRTTLRKRVEQFVRSSKLCYFCCLKQKKTKESLIDQEGSPQEQQQSQQEQELQQVARHFPVPQEELFV